MRTWSSFNRSYKPSSGVSSMWTVRGHVVCLPLGGQVTGSKKCRHRHRQRTVGHGVPNSDSSGPTIHPDTSYRWDAPSQTQKLEPKQDSKERSLCDLRLSQARSKERRTTALTRHLRTPRRATPPVQQHPATARALAPGKGSLHLYTQELSKDCVLA